MKKTTKKPVKKVTKSNISELEAEVARLSKRVYELENPLSIPPKPKEPETFEDCVNLHKEAFDIVYPEAPITEAHCHGDLYRGSAVPSTERAKQLMAIAKMMTVADALNDGREGDYVIVADHNSIYTSRGDSKEMITFYAKDKAEKAVKILGEETIKTAYGL